MRVHDIMKSKVVSISQEEKLDLVDDIMGNGNIRHMPVTRGGRVVGILSHRDLLKAMLSTVIEFSKEDRKDLLKETEVSQVMTKEVQFTHPEESVANAVQRMLDYKVGCLPVVNQNHELAGLVTETDAMQLIVDTFGKNSPVDG
jgi:CBS domain-containing protein